MYSFWRTSGDDRKTYVYLGLVCSLLPVFLVIFIAVGGVLSYVALAVCLIIGFFTATVKGIRDGQAADENLVKYSPLGGPNPDIRSRPSHVNTELRLMLFT